jgi:UDP-N-acetylmuramate dehydrogenase
VLGGGSNVLFARDVDEPMILMRIPGRQLLDDDGTDVLVEVGAGETWDRIVHWTLSQGWFGLENLSLIPGLAGGAPWQNIGAYGVEAAERIAVVTAVDLRTGTRREFPAAECGFGYRTSFFKTPPGRQWLITAVRLRLSRRADPRTAYGEILRELGAAAPSPLQVAAAVRSIRRRKLPDPAVTGNAGSFFKNPVIGMDALEPLRSAYPDMPAYPVVGDATRVKLSAGWLIETAGWKGHRDGDAGVSARHALVLVNHGSATGAQVLALARRIRQSVLDRFGVALEPEPVIVQ